MKKNIKKKKAQTGLQKPINSLNPNAVAANTTDWMMDNTLFPQNPAYIDPINLMDISQQAGYDPNANVLTPTNQPSRTIKYLNQGEDPYVGLFNATATGITGVANMLQNNRLKNKERRTVLQNQGSKYWENMEADGLNNIPAYTQAGGPTKGKKKAQTGTSTQPQYSRLNPQQMTEWNQYLDFVKSKGYEGSAELNQKNKNLGASLFTDFKKANPNVSIGYDIVPSVQNEMQILKQNTQAFLQRRNDPNAANVMNTISPVDGWFGSQTSQYRFPSQSTQTFHNGQLVNRTNDGLLNSNLQTTGPSQNGYNPARRSVPQGAKIETVQDGNGQTRRVYEDPTTGDLVDVMQAGGAPGFDVEAESGEVVEGADGTFATIEGGQSHEKGGVDVNNVSRVLETTSDKRKDKASKLLKVDTSEMKELFDIKSKRSVSHAKAFDIANDKYSGQRDKVNRANKNINEKPFLDKLAANSAELNYKFMKEIPSEEDVFDALFMHQQEVKRINNIQDDGSMAKKGGKFKAQAGTGGRRGRGAAVAAANSTTVVADENGQPVEVPVPTQTAAATAARPYGATPSKTPQGSMSVRGVDVNQGLPVTPSEWEEEWRKAGVDLSQYPTMKEKQLALYNKALESPAGKEAVLNMWNTTGLTNYGRQNQKALEAAGIKLAPSQSDPYKRLDVPDYNALTTDQLRVLGQNAYGDNNLLYRTFRAGVFEEPPTTTTTTETTPGVPVNTNVNITPPRQQQAPNTFFEPTYWDELAAPLAGLTEGRDPELYNNIEFNQLRYKQLDPTAALNANQSDFNAVADQLGNMNVGSGAAAANLANLGAQKYNANNQILSQYENQNAGIKNNEVNYNTQVRDRQSLADASNRATYYRNVQQSREAQRQQRLTSIQDISRVIQMKRRQNNSGNLILKTTPHFNQFGDYNGEQQMYTLPSENYLPPGYETKNTITTKGKKYRILKDAKGKEISREEMK